MVDLPQDDLSLSIFFLASYIFLRTLSSNFINLDWFYQSKTDGSKLTKKYGESVIDISLKTVASVPLKRYGNGNFLLHYENGEYSLVVSGMQSLGSVSEGKLQFYYNNPVESECIIHNAEMVSRFSTRTLGIIRKARYPELSSDFTVYGYESEELTSRSSMDTYLQFTGVDQSHYSNLPDVSLSFVKSSPSESFLKLQIHSNSTNIANIEFHPAVNPSHLTLVTSSRQPGESESEEIYSMWFLRKGESTDSDICIESSVEFCGEYSEGLSPEYVTGQGIWNKKFRIKEQKYTISTFWPPHEEAKPETPPGPGPPAGSNHSEE